MIPTFVIIGLEKRHAFREIFSRRLKRQVIVSCLNILKKNMKDMEKGYEEIKPYYEQGRTMSGRIIAIQMYRTNVLYNRGWLQL
jgi:hypothetical protein